MKNYFIFIFSLFILIQCNSSTKESPFDFFCEPFSLSNAKVGDRPFVSYYPDIISKFGSPTSVRDSCSYTPIYYKQGRNYSDCLEFKNIPGVVFNRFKDTLFVSTIDFTSINVPVTIYDKELSQNTTIDSIILACDVLKESINKGGNLLAILKDQEWIYLYENEGENRRNPRRNELELRFSDRKLVHLSYVWKPNYSDIEWKNYLKVKNELELRK